MQNYTIVKEVVFRKIYPKMPVEILKGHICVDNDKNSYLNLQLCNVSKKSIKALYLEIKCFDDAGDEVIAQDSNCAKYAFIDAIYKSQDVFGDNEYVKLIEKTVRNVEIIIDKIVYEDTEVYRFSDNEEWINVEMPEKIEPEDVKFFLEFSDSKMSMHAPLYFPIDNHSNWICTCGRYNSSDQENCIRCGRGKTRQCQYITQEVLDKLKKDDLLHEKSVVESENKRSSFWRILIVGAVLVAVILYIVNLEIAKKYYKEEVEKYFDSVEVDYVTYDMITPEKYSIKIFSNNFGDARVSDSIINAVKGIPFGTTVYEYDLEDVLIVSSGLKEWNVIGVAGNYEYPKVATSKPSLLLKVVDGWTWSVDGDYSYIRGSVKNTGTEMVDYFEVKAKFLDSQGNVLDTDYTNSGIELYPGEQKEFEIMHENNDNYDSVNISVDNY